MMSIYGCCAVCKCYIRAKQHRYATPNKIEMGDNKTETKSKREAFLSRMKEKHPDVDFDDEDARYGQFTDDLDALESENGAMRDREGKLTTMFNSHPQAAAMMVDWMDGGDPVVTLVKRFGPELSEALQDPEKQEQLAAAQKDYLERVAKEKELEAQYQENLSASLTELDKIQEELGLTDEKADEALKLIIKIANDAIMGIFTRESLEMVLKAINYDTDVAAADYEGEVRGKNTKITEKLRQKEAGDGVPVLGGKSGGALKTQPVDDIFSQAAMAR